MARIVIVGGGIAGLSAAYDLQRDGRHQVTLLERSDRLGGKIVSHRIDGMIVEGGPDSVFTTKPWAVDLMTELGLETEIEEPIGSGFSMLVDGKLHAVPRALASLIPSDSNAVEAVGFWDELSRRRIFSEIAVPKGDGSDESVAAFFRRRFGDRFSKTLAEPLLGGIQAGNPETLSMKALYPSYIGLEQKNGCLTESGKAPSSGRSSFITLQGGLYRFVEAVAARLSGVDVRYNFEVAGIERSSTGLFRILGSDGLEADAIVLAISSFAAASLIRSLAPDAYDPLMRVRHTSTAVVSFAFRGGAFDKGLDGNGFLVPAGEPANITGCTYSSSKWPDRAPEGVALVRAFMGRDGGLNVDDFTDERLVETAQAELIRLLGARELPSARHLDRWTRSMPQYDLGHTHRMDQIEQAIGPLPILLAGCSYRGTGIPDCIRQGRQAAKRILDNEF